MSRHILICLAIIVAVAVALAGCGQAAVVATSSSAAPAATSGWQKVSGKRVTISLPAGWTVADLTADKAQSYYDAMKKSNPEMAALVDPTSLAGADLWATGPGPSLHDWLIIRGIARAGVLPDDIKPLDVLQPIIGQLKNLGIEITKTDASLTIAGSLAAAITYRLPVKRASGEQIMPVGKMCLVLTSTDAWIIGFTFWPGSQALTDGMAEKALATLEIKPS